MKYIIIGNGVAGTKAAEKIRELDKQGSIDIFTDESTPFYTRIRLPDYIAGEVEVEDIVLHKTQWYQERNIGVHLGEAIQEIDPKKKRVLTARGERHTYDRLLLATGGRSFVPPISGVEKIGIFTLRTVKDAKAIREWAEMAEGAVIIGGGLLGLEAGNGLRKRGLKVTVVEFFPRLLPRQLDTAGAEILKGQMEAMGFRFYLGAKSQEIRGKDGVENLFLEGGESISCDMILISAGVRSNLDLSKKLGLEGDKGLVVDDRLETPIKDIYAAGDLIQHRGVFYGIWPASEKQGEVSGINMAGKSAVYGGTVISNRLKVVGIDLVSAGEIDVEGKLEFQVTRDDQKYIYRKLVLKDDTLVGCILLGDITGNQNILRAIEKKMNVKAFKSDLLNKAFDFKKLRS